MSSDITRRSFIKTAGVAAGVAVAAGYNPLSYAQNDKIKLGIIGTGGQARGAHIAEGLTVNKDQIDIVALCDIFLPHLDAAYEMAGGNNGKKINKYMDCKEMLDKENLDAVLVTTPLYLHYPIVMDCLDAGVYVFCEKTLAYTIDECRNIVKKCNETGKFLQVGHQRRYNPYYNKAMWLAHDKNLIGRINHITAQWHRNDSWRRPVPDYKLTPEELKYFPDTNLDKHINWRLYNDRSGGLMTELGAHQLDVASWFLGGAPKRVSAFGGIDYWKDGRECDDNIVLIYEWDVRPGMNGFRTIEARDSHQNAAKLNLPYTVRMTYSSICANAKRNYSELLQGDRGSFELIGEQRCQLFVEPWVGREAEAKKKAAAGKGGEAKAEKSLIPGAAMDAGIPLDVYTDDKGGIEYNVWMANHNSWAGFCHDLKNGGTPKANQMTGLISGICALKGNEALAKGGTVDIDPELLAFDFETPDPYRYDFVEGPIPGQKPKTEDGAAAPTA